MSRRGSVLLGLQDRVEWVVGARFTLESMEAEVTDAASSSYRAIPDIAAAVEIQAGAVVSKVVFRDDDANVTVFGLDAGEELTEHSAGRPAVVQVLSGRLRFTVDGDELDAGPGFWLHMAAGASHSLVASEPSVMLLTLHRP